MSRLKAGLSKNESGACLYQTLQERVVLCTMVESKVMAMPLFRGLDHFFGYDYLTAAMPSETQSLLRLSLFIQLRLSSLEEVGSAVRLVGAAPDDKSEPSPPLLIGVHFQA